MGKKRYTPEQIIGKLREAEVLLAQGQTASQVCRTLGIAEPTFYCWRLDCLRCEVLCMRGGIRRREVQLAVRERNDWRQARVAQRGKPMVEKAEVEAALVAAMRPLCSGLGGRFERNTHERDLGEFQAYSGFLFMRSRNNLTHYE
jgi:hypothetical protein